MNRQAVTLDVSKQPGVMPLVRLRESDLNATMLEVTVLDHGIAAAFAGAVLRIKDSNRTCFEFEGTVAANIATFTIDETGMAAGKCKAAYVEIAFDDGDTTSTQRIEMHVGETAMQNGKQLKLLHIRGKGEASGSPSATNPPSVSYVQKPTGNKFGIYIDGRLLEIDIGTRQLKGIPGNNGITNRDELYVDAQGRVFFYSNIEDTTTTMLSSVTFSSGTARCVVALSGVKSGSAAWCNRGKASVSSTTVTVSLPTSTVGTTESAVKSWWTSNRPRVVFVKSSGSSVQLNPVTLPEVSLKPTLSANSAVQPFSYLYGFN